MVGETSMSKAKKRDPPRERSRAFDLEAIDRLFFLHMCPIDSLVLSGDGLLNFAGLVAAGLASFRQKPNKFYYVLNTTVKGNQLIEAWRQGNRARLTQELGGATSEDSGAKNE